MVVAITGASGHVGVNLCQFLATSGYDLKLLINKNNAGLQDLQATIVKGNILDESSVEQLIKGADYVIHLAAKISIDGDKDRSVYTINVEGTKNVIEASKKWNVKKLVFFSSIHTLNPFPLGETLDETKHYVKKPTSYDASKIAAEQLVYQAHKDGLNTNIICPTSVFGPNDFYPSLLGQAIIDMFKGSIPALTKGGYNFVDVKDLVLGTIAIMEKGKSGEKYILSGTYLSIRELAQLIGKQAVRPKKKIVLPFWLLEMAIPLLKLWAAVLKQNALFTKESLLALKHANRKISSAKAREHVGYTTRPIDTSIKDTILWFKQNNQL